MAAFSIADPRKTRVENAVLACFDKGWMPDAWSIAETLVDEDVAAGEYEGCSVELEMEFDEFRRLAEEALSDA